MSNPHPLKKNQWKKGQSGNPDGKPPGTLDFKTKWFKFVDKIAAQNDITPEEVEEQLLAVAFKQAKDANYQFWKDIHDRVHGKAGETLDITSKGEQIKLSPAMKAYADKLLDGQRNSHA